MKAGNEASTEAPGGGGPPARVAVGGIPTTRLTAVELARLMVGDCLAPDRETRPPRLVFSTNGHAISLAGTDQDFVAAMAEADIVHADGMSVVFASRLLSARPLPERVATTDFFHDAARAAAENGLKFYFLGGREEINAAAYDEARRLYPDVRWVGRHHGYFAGGEEAALCAAIRAAKPDVLWVGLGRPKQESFAARRREDLRGVAWIKTCGGLYDFLAGSVKRAPAWMQRAGLEWTWRLAQEPGRLAGRYAITNVHALWRMFVHRRNP